MKDIDAQLIQSQDKQVQEIPVPTGRVNMGNTPIFKGMTLWEINMSTLECLPAKFKSSAVELKKQIGKSEEDGTVVADIIHHQCVNRKGYFYAIALNKKNALRKFRKLNPI